MPITTFLFDLDGTLMDTDALHHAAFNTILARWDRHIGVDDYKTHIMGHANAAIFGYLFPGMPASEYLPLADEKESLFRAQLEKEVAPTPGIAALLDHIDRIGGRRAVVTNAPRANAELMLKASGLAARFDTLVIGDELARGKPDPLPYLTALQLLGARAEEAVAFEDSSSGVKAASAAGLYTFGMLTGLDEARLKAAGAQAAIRDFNDRALWDKVQDQGADKGGAA
ncbi:HAD family hydrolase [Herbaspirillum robiniae]|uniref:Haloacid dehalogenase n=1 Tax=Herbaspirillum robiniae TaxID=2014887 RepID=A0A246WPD5_9BURK|nr:HAD-IA family hydrolase [Herbaspirillum robiniae]OWY28233.1 haloacid dehalogenase [Herbaspirillum robiniae]